MDIIYIYLKQAIEVHDLVLAKGGGGFPGIKDRGQLESILEHMQNDLYYPTFEEKLTHLLFSIIKFHVFFDGNKRSAIALVTLFLNLNGFEYCCPRFINESENIVVWIAENKIPKDFLKELIENILNDYEYTEDIKLKLINYVGIDALIKK
ncbi:type II toxin-antitoxin system death-on-curing family toxin [Intestinibacter bartlettii]|uniref:type II toxin-antitoxin system death-on-curing family toxin n=1 Tax=Intestinibacter bartlettii TaxID=261299 RepID=UPI000822D879|nr:type II toxin-antitoxin system death-on-curing family toxin [Intestinibacter bartlettii]SCJ11012.1 death-on-curing family protein [uncultured Clostridium sp.]